MSTTDQIIKQKISETEAELNTRNDAVGFATEVVAACRKSVAATVNGANSTKSYDEKQDILVDGLKNVLDLQEQALRNLIDDVTKFKLQLETLQGILQSSADAEEAKKKEAEALRRQQEETVQE